MIQCEGVKFKAILSTKYRIKLYLQGKIRKASSSRGFNAFFLGVPRKFSPNKSMIFRCCNDSPISPSYLGDFLARLYLSRTVDCLQVAQTHASA